VRGFYFNACAQPRAEFGQVILAAGVGHKVGFAGSGAAVMAQYINLEFRSRHGADKFGYIKRKARHAGAVEHLNG